jgi:hypothetical protein
MVIESVVDYGAWRKGYMPPTEHILIDQLAYRGARVITMSDWGDRGAVWIVVRGKTLSAATRKQLHALIDMIDQEELEAVCTAATQK